MGRSAGWPGALEGVIQGANMKKDEKKRPKGETRGAAPRESGFNADEPVDMETALRCIKLLDDLGSQGMVEGILETIRSIRDKMTNPYARKLIDERLREFSGKAGEQLH